MGSAPISRKQFLFTVGALALTSFSRPSNSFGEPGKVAKQGSITLSIQDGLCIFTDNFGHVLLFKQTGSDSATITGEDGVEHYLSITDEGIPTYDGMVLTTEVDDPLVSVPFNCVLMSTRKMTVKQAAAPTQLLHDILSNFGNIPAQIASNIASYIFNQQVNSHADMWLIMKHWYCDSPKRITRKQWFLYSDKACTKLVKSWSTEAPA